MRSAALALLLIGSACAQVRYFGKEVGALSQLHHGVRGRVYAVDSRTIYLRDFSYDGEGPAAYFFVGTSSSPNAAGITGGVRLRDERGGAGPLRRYRGESITLSLPDGKTIKDFKWFSVWCEEFSINFGDVSIPRGLEYPRPAKVGALRGVHGVSSDQIVVVDAQTLLVPNFSYDGEAPDAKFWVGRGDKPSPQGIRIPDENGKEVPLRKYDRKTIVLTLPGELTVFDIGHFAVWCEAFTVNFGHVSLPAAQLANVPPSLKMLGVSPQNRNKALAGSAAPPRSSTSKPRPRKPIARVDATTYRPNHLRSGSGVLAALLDQPSDPSLLHRRADDSKPPRDQLVTIQSSKEVHYHKEEDTIAPPVAPQRSLQDGQHQQQAYYPQPPDYNQQQNILYYQQQPQYQQDHRLHNVGPSYQQIRTQQDELQQQYEQQDAYLRILRQKLQDEQPYQYRLLPYESGK